MAYQANGSANIDAEKARNDANNAKNVRNAADAAIASKNPYAAGAGLAVKGADALTGGKASEAIGKGLTAANKVSPLGNHAQNFSNRAAESGLSDAVGKGSRLASNMHNGSIHDNTGAGISPDKMPNQVKNNQSGGEQNDSSLPSSDGKNQVPPRTGSNDDSVGDKKKRRNSTEDDEKKEDSYEEDSGQRESKSFLGVFSVTSLVMIATVVILPIIMLGFILIFVVFSSTSFIAGFEDAFGASEASGEEYGNVDFKARSDEQKNFYDRINSVKLNLQARGKTVDAYKVAAVYYVINDYDSMFSYNRMSEDVITDIANSMFSGNTYDESTFKNNLVSDILPKYASRGSSNKSPNYSSMADAVIEYIDNYESMIDKKNTSSYRLSCSANGSCTYDIKGYYIQGKGNVTENIQVKDLYVRLMQCGVGNGHNYGGTFGRPLEGEALVPFEKYVLGVAYQEIGPDAPAEAIKAQMIAARSYILARHADMGGWRTLKEESGRWVIQVASCTQDQVYCDPDQGCSSNDGQWGQIHSGQSHNTGFSRAAMPETSPLRTYASQTSGEVLINQSGFIVYTGYLQSEQDQFVSLANNGLNYKQILLQVYNQGSRSYGASDISRATCESRGSASCGGAVGDYINWKQKGETWSETPMGNSGRTIGSIGCLVTSIAMQIARSGVPVTVSDFNPGTFVEQLNANGGFDGYGNFSWAVASSVAPSFQYQGKVFVEGMSREQKLATITDLVSQPNTYVVAEVMGNTGQHWVAINSVNGDSIVMMDPGSSATDLWSEYNWANTSTLAYYKVNS